jgi:bifunctional NMN adenylyltransferase/nudix hydrolase
MNQNPQISGDSRFLDTGIVPTIEESTKSAGKRYDATVFIGRFQPYHISHHATVSAALERSDRVIILVGSVFGPRSPRNPFTYQERRDMIMMSIPPEQRSRVLVRAIFDWTYMGNRWLIETKKVVNDCLTELGLKKPSIALIGHKKDASSYYLNMFSPDWASIDVDNHMDISGTHIRNAYFSNICEMWLRSQAHHENEPSEPRDHVLSAPVHGFLTEFAKTAEYKLCAAEIQFDIDNHAVYASLPYPPVFVTVDAVVVHRGKILLVKRRALPGKGLWALPGGYLMKDRTLLDSMLIEVKEETNIKVPPSVLLGSIVWHREFDDPFRSSRGRVITHAYMIHLSNDMEQPKVRARIRDDSDKGDPDGGTEYAQWFDLSEVTRDMMFEDHWFLIQVMIAQLENKATPTNLHRR